MHISKSSTSIHTAQNRDTNNPSILISFLQTSFVHTSSRHKGSSKMWATGFADGSKANWATLAAVTVLSYIVLRCLYNLYFHPAAKYPGPKLAAISNVWYVRVSLDDWQIPYRHRGGTGEQYGDVVRIAPNALVFITPKAAAAGHIRLPGQGLGILPTSELHQSWMA
ncbi:hypothetical protein F4778DRAFT_18792 [Xylariomycetidae sp. FL2044]|nr:hypothetical protein F4778DRAFT_18792 [Xylariomycetidae sp. FL2044]